VFASIAMVITRMLLLGAIAVSACYREHRDTGWFAERGERAASWYVCTSLGASLRAACQRDAACATRVTWELTLPCYAARYHAATHDGRPAQPSTLSPCFWTQDAAPGTSPEQYARATCARLGMAAELQVHCVGELREVMEKVCTSGGTELTGAGP
jgi:hypothetical protein